MKKLRQEALLKLIRDEEIDTQERLKSGLEKKGFKVTQATVSRDINELNLVKILASNGSYKYSQLVFRDVQKSPLEQLHSLMGNLALSLDYALNTVVIKCQTGMAQAVCAKLDEAELPQIVGTLAGDDTIFVLVRTEAEAKRLVSELSKDITA